MMSSWFYNLTNRWTGTADVHDTEPSTSQQIRPLESPTEVINRALDELSEQQRDTIQEVLRRAEESRKYVRVVMDGRKLGQLRGTSLSVDEGQAVDGRQLVQMDSIPEDIIITDNDTSTQKTTAEKRISWGRRQSTNLTTRMKMVSTHIAQWFNTLDYDGDYLSTGLQSDIIVPYVEGDLQNMTLKYIDALSSGIVIAACMEYCGLQLKYSPYFQEFCRELCESIFELAYSQIEMDAVNEAILKEIDHHCAVLSERVLTTVYIQLFHKVVGGGEDEDIWNELTEKHKQLSFHSAGELDDYLERISEGDENEALSNPSDEDLPTNEKYRGKKDESSTPQQIEKINDDDIVECEQESTSSSASIISVIERRPRLPHVEIIVRPPTPPARPPPPRQTIKKQYESQENTRGDERRTKDEEQNMKEETTEQQSQPLYIAKEERQKNSDDHEDYEKQLTHLKRMQIKNCQREQNETPLGENETDIITSIHEITQELELVTHRTSTPTEDTASSSTSGADESRSSFDREPSSEQRHDYGRDSPLLEPTIEEEEPEEDVVKPSEVTLAEERTRRDEAPLTQEELDHIAWVAQLATQSSFDKPVRPPTPETVKETAAPVDAPSSATSGADESRSSFDREPSSEQRHDYGRDSPLLEPTIEEEEPEEDVVKPSEVTLAEERTRRDEAPLTQEELDHIAWVAQLATQSSFDKPVRPPTPETVKETAAPVDAPSSATSGADESRSSFDREPSSEQRHDYGRDSPLLEPTIEEEEPEEDVVKPSEVTLAEERTRRDEAPLTQEELDHIAWVAQLATQSSFDKPVRPPTPETVKETAAPVDAPSSATSGADESRSSFDREPSSEQRHDYGRDSPLLEPTIEEEEPEEDVVKPSEVTLAEERTRRDEAPLTQEELDHIAWVAQLATQSSFDKPVRPPTPETVKETAAPVDAPSSATSGADESRSSFDREPSSEQRHDYGRDSPLLEPTIEEEEPEEDVVKPSEVTLAEERTRRDEAPLTQEELDHIAWVAQLATQSSFDKPVRPPTPETVKETAAPVDAPSSATSGADESRSSFDREPSSEQRHDYGRDSPLLEPTIEEEEPEEDVVKPSEVTLAEERTRRDEAPLTQEELDHIAWVAQLATQSSFDKPVRPPTPETVKETAAPVDAPSSATSGADESRSSFDREPSSEQRHDYGRDSPLLEPTIEEEEPEEDVVKPSEVTLAEERTRRDEAPLTQEELDHIAWVAQLATQSSFDKPVRPPTPETVKETAAPVDAPSSATSGADESRSSFDREPSSEQRHDYGRDSPLLEPTIEEEEPEEDVVKPSEVTLAEERTRRDEAPLTQEELDHIAWVAQLATQSSFDKPVRPPTPETVKETAAPVDAPSSATSGADESRSSFDREPSSEQRHDYGRDSPLLEPTIEEEEPEEDVVKPSEVTLAEERTRRDEAPLTQEELDHIAWVAQLATQSSFDKPVRPPTPETVKETAAPVDAPSSATSGADESRSSFDREPSSEQRHDYGRDSPLLEPTIEEEEPEEDVVKPSEVTLAEERTRRDEAPLTQEELDHIAWVAQLATQSSFDKPVRPPTPETVKETAAPVDAPSSATSGADESRSSFDREPSSEQRHDYGRDSPLLEPTIEEEEPEEDVVKPSEVTLAEERTRRDEAPLTQEELDHIAWVAQLATQSSFDKPVRPPTPETVKETAAPVDAPSSATSGADESRSSFDREPSSEQRHDYGRDSPLLEPTIEEEEPEEDVVKPSEVTLAEERTRRDEAPLTQEELDHIAWVAQLATQSSFDKPVRPPTPETVKETAAPVDAPSSATSGADESRSSFDREPSSEQRHDYGRDSPLLEPTIEEEEPEEDVVKPSEVTLAEERTRRDEAPLTQEELDHIAWVAQLATQSSFDKPVRPPTPETVKETAAPVDAPSSATSGADESRSSFDREPSSEQRHDYGRDSPLLEPTIEEEEPEEDVVKPSEVTLAEERTRRDEAPLTQEELDHIAWVAQLATQSSFDKPVRPPTPETVKETAAPVDAPSSATSGADESRSSFDREPSSEQRHDYGRDSPLLEPTIEEEEPEEDVVKPSEVTLAEERTRRDEAPLTQEELDHIAWVAQLATQSSFDKPVRPPTPETVKETAAPVDAPSSATSGADESRSSFDREPSSEQRHDYGRDSPLLEPTIEEEEPEEDVVKPSEVTLAEERTRRDEAPLTQEELDHIAWVAQLATQSSFDKPVRPPTPETVKETAAPVDAPSSATSGADESRSSFDREPSSEQRHDYGRDSPLLEPTIEEEEPEEDVVKPSEVTLAEERTRRDEAPLTQEELDHIAWVAQLATQSSFDKPVRPPTPETVKETAAPVDAPSSATSGADESRSSFDREPSSEQRHDYGRDSPLLEPTIEEEEPEEDVVKPSEVTLAEERTRRDEAPLTQEELDHIAWVAQLATQSSFDKPVRPPTPETVKETAAPVDAPSSATSGADESRSSFDREPSSEQRHDYGRDSPLLEPTIEEEEPEEDVVKPSEVTLAEERTRRDEAPLTQEELDHIAWVAQLATQSSFDKPVRPPTPETVKETAAPVDAPSSATSGADESRSSFDREPSSEQRHDYGRDSPLLEPTIEEEEPEEDVVKPSEVTLAEERTRRDEAPLTQEELDHIAWVAQLATQSSFDKPVRPPTPETVKETAAPVDAPSSATSGADESRSSFDREPSSEQRHDYGRDSPLLEPTIEEEEPEEDVVKPSEVTLAEERTRRDEAPLTQEELDHIAWVAQLATQSSFDKPVRPPTPETVKETAAPVDAPSSATSGADESRSSFDREPSSEQRHDYGRDSPLLEPTIEEEEPEEDVVKPSEVTLAEERTRRDEAPLTQEELDHIAWVAQLATQSSFDKPVRPPTPETVKETAAPVDAPSSATSGADESRSSFDREPSSEQRHDYGRDSPLLEPTIEEEEPEEDVVKPSEVTLAEERTRRDEAPLTQEELDHIAWVAQLATQSSFDKPVRPPTPETVKETAAPVDAPSSATSGADESRSSFDREPSSEQRHDYGRDSPLLEPTIEEEEPEEDVVKPSEVTLAEERTRRDEAPLTQEELDHIAWVAQLATQSSFDKPVRPPTPETVKETAAPVDAPSSATSGADESRSSFDREPSSEQRHDYGRDSPLLEPTIEEEEPEEDVVKPSEVTLAEERTRRDEAPLTQEELDHIAWVAQLATQSSFDKPVRPPTPETVKETAAPVDAPSSATSGADESRSSFDREPSSEQRHDYGRDSPLLEPTIEEEEPEEDVVKPSEVTLAEERTRRDEAPLTQEELDHIAWVAQLATQSSFDKPVRPPTPETVKETAAPVDAPSSATSGADESRSSFDREPSSEQRHDYGRDSPLLEPTIEEEEPEEDVVKPSEVTLAEERTRRDEAPLTQEELDHIAWVAQLATQSSFDKPVRPPTPETVKETAAPVDAPSSATSGADESRSSFDREPSSEQRHDYGRDSPLLEPTIEEEEPEEDVVKPSEVTLAEERTRRDEAPLTQEELDHIAWVAQLATQSSFDKPVRPPTPETVKETAAPVDAPSSATSGADESRSSFDREPSSEQRHDYGRDSPLLEPTIEEEEPEEDVVKPSEVTLAEERTRRDEAPLTQEELDHIAWVAQLATQSSFDKPVRPPTPETVKETAAPVDAPSSATSGADESRSSFDREPSSEQRHDYGRDSPLLEPTIEEEEPEEDVVKPSEVTLAEERTRRDEAPLTQEELDHIAWVAQLATQSSFDKPVRPPTPETVKETAAPVDAPSSATSGADESRSSFDREPSSEQRHDYGRDSPLLEPTIEEEEPEEDVVKPSEVTLAEERTRRDEAPLTQEELDHIAWVAQLATQSSFDKPVRPPTPETVKETAAPVDAPSSATSGADESRSSFDREPSSEQRHDYGRDSPLLEPTIEEEEPEEDVVKPSEVTLAEERTRRDEAPLTQEELDHIAWVAQLATQSSFDKPVRPPTPETVKETAAPVDAPSSATSGADESRSSFDREPSSEQRHDYGRDSPLLEPTIEEEEPEEDVVKPSEVTLAEERTTPLTQEELGRVSATELSPRDGQAQEASSFSPMGVEVSDEWVVDIVESHVAGPMLCYSPAVECSMLPDMDGRRSSASRSPSAGDVKSPGSVYRSYSDIRIEVPQFPLDVKSSLSLSCVSEKCGELHLRLNAFELCEQHSFTQSKNLLCNVDFLCRLNFVANRMTEDIAETAGKELLDYYQSFCNPRARYFGKHDFPSRSVSEDTDSECQRETPMEPPPLSDNEQSVGGLFRFLLGNRKSVVERPRSSLSVFYSDAKRKASEQPYLRKRSDGSDVLSLLRRSSGVDSQSPMRLPDTALVGLTDDEKEHVKSVLQRSIKSQSPSLSRRPSSQLQMLPEMDGISEEEREHIQAVLDRANSCYILPRRPASAQPTTSQNRCDQQDGIMEKIGTESQTNYGAVAEGTNRVAVEVKEKLAAEENIPILSNVSSKPAISQLEKRENVENAALQPHMDNVVNNMEERASPVGTAAVEVDGGLTSAELEHIRRIQEMAEADSQTIPVMTKRYMEDIDSKRRNTETTELSAEELEHIRKVQEMAEADTHTISFVTSGPEPNKNVERIGEIRIPVEPIELSAEELEQIQRIQEMADADWETTAVSVRKETAEREKTKETTELSAEEMKHIRQIQEMAEMDTHLTELKKIEEENTDGDGLTAEEMEHIRRIQEMAELEMASFEQILKESQPPTNKEVIIQVDDKTAAEPWVEQAPQNEKYELSEEELAHIRKIEAMANMDEFSWEKKEHERVPDTGLTAEEMEHIRRVTELADLENLAPQLPCISPEMTGEPLFDEYDMIEFKQANSPPYVEIVPNVETFAASRLDTWRDEERIKDVEQQRVMERRASYDAHYPRDVFDQEEYSPALGADFQNDYEKETSEEELAHIRRVRELAERASIYAEQGIELSSDDLKKYTEEKRLLRGEYQNYLEEEDFNNGEFTLGEMEEIRRISERDEDGLPEEMPTYDLPTPDYGYSDITFYPEADGNGPDTTDELKSHILDRSSPAKDGSGGVDINYGADGHPPHELSSQVVDEEMSFDIKEVREMPRDERLGKWYETQLSFVRDSIADEEEERELSPEEWSATADLVPFDNPQEGDTISRQKAEWKEESFNMTGPAAPSTSSTDSSSLAHSRIDSGVLSSMFTTAKPGRFGFSGLGKFAQDAFDKAKKAGEQLQAAAVEPPRTQPAAAESEEERLRREAVEACARLDALSSETEPQPVPLLPPGIEDLPIEEQQKILAVLADAESQAVSPLPVRQPIEPKQMPTTQSHTDLSTSLMPDEPVQPRASAQVAPLSTQSVPSGLDELSKEEQERILAVIAQAEAMDAEATQPSNKIERPMSSTLPPVTTQSTSVIPPGLEELSQEERDRILAVIANAEIAMDEPPQRKPSKSEPERQIEESVPRIPEETAETQTTKPIVEVEPTVYPQMTEWASPREMEQKDDWTIPRTTQLPFGPATETNIDADLSPLAEEESLPPLPSIERRQPSMISSTDSPVRESGYGTASTSYATELGDFAYKPSSLLDDTMDQREGATSRNGSRADEVADDDFTYSDQRFSDLHDDNIFEVTEDEGKAVVVDAVEANQPNWSQRGRMWTTVFEGDEHSKDEHHEIESPKDIIEMDEIYDNVFSGTRAFKEIEFDSTPKPKEQPKKAEEKIIPPEIILTVHEDRRSDSEEEDSGSEDDDEYPDRVVVAPVAASPSFEEVEQERLQQEQFGKEVLQQIQAFGESANDEFDVQWAKTALESKKPDLAISSQSSSQPLDVTAHLNRKNPFLSSPEEEDVSVDVEDLDLQRIYQTQIGGTHRPVYTIPEDENEPRGTTFNTDSKLHAKEKRRMAARSVADQIIQLSSANHTPSTTTSIVFPIPESTTTESKTSQSSLYSSSYLFSTAPFVLPTSSGPLYTSPTTTSSVLTDKQKKDAELNSKIDKTLSDIHDLLDSCAVYTSDKAKPNLLCYSGTAFQTPTSGSLGLAPEECTSCSPSPSFLLPLSATLVREQHETEPHTGTLGSGLRRSPGMMLPTGEGEAPAIAADSFTKEKAQVMPWRDVLEDDGPAAAQDMGRRKLPSIPSQPAFSTTVTYPAPPPGAYVVPPSSETQRMTARVPPAQSFLSSSAPSTTTAEPFALFGPSTGTQTNGLPPMERPSSALSFTSTASTSRARDPAILPGASFHPRPRVALRQPVSSIIGRRSSGGKVPNTLARVLLKKELKEALTRRKETLEACEIEANQRQYVVHRMLVTGLLPEGREDDTPNVIPCLLPVELIDGARVIPKKTCTVATQKSDDDTRPSYEPQPPKPPQHTRSSIGVQIDEPLLDRSRGYSMPSTSLSQQMRNLSTYKQSTETQTDATTLPFYKETPLDRERIARLTRHDATAQTTDLLEATRKYFEDYDRKLKELGAKAKRHHHKHHYHFHDDEDSLSREQRRNELSDELARRRERLWTSDVYEGAPDAYHYGSLPRMERSHAAPRDFTVRENVYNPSPSNYASLPRNYERMMGPAPLEPIQIEYEQSFGGRPSYQTGYGTSQPLQTRSLLDINTGYTPYPTYNNMGGQNTYRGKSLNYLDQLDESRRTAPWDNSYSYQDGRRYPATSLSYSHGRPYAQDTTNLSYTGPRDLLSQYATYLQREYQPTLLAAEPRTTLPSRRPYDAPLSDPYRFSDQAPRMTSRFDGYLNDDRGYGTLPAAMPPIQTRYEAPLSDPYAGPADFAVYSRSEENYGSRPPAYSLDYGNLQRNRAVYPRNERDDALSRVYASRRRVAEQPFNQPPYRFRSLGHTHPTDVVPSQSVTSPRSNNTKRLLLTRCYRDHNIYNDLGVRVVGGKRMKDGTLGAFVSAVNQGKYNQTLGEIRPGDQVLEWNGVFLTGKTFEEVERIVNSSSGEVEVVVRTGEPEYTQTGEFDIRTASPERRPPVPMHKKQNTRIYDNVETLNTRRTAESDLGFLQIGVFYDQRLCKLIVRILSARGLKLRDPTSRTLPNPFVKVYLLPGRKVSHKRRTRFVPCSVNPEWNQQVEYEVPSTTLYSHCLELSLWDYDKFSESNALGRVIISLSDPSALSGVPRWYTIEALDSRSARNVLNAPLEKNMSAAHNYVPAALDIGYPAID